MSQDPSAAFLASGDPTRFLASGDPTRFLASGDPTRFLDDNLPSEPVEDTEEHRKHRLLAVGLAGAFLAWRTMASAQLRLLEPPTVAANLYDVVERYTRPVWLQVAGPVIDRGLADIEGLASYRVLRNAADSVSGQVGRYLMTTSTSALISGYTAELAIGRSPLLAWLKPALAFGLDERGMRSFLLSARRQEPSWANEVLSEPSQKALQRALMQRADVVGQTEGWSARAQARTMLWMAEQARGELGSDARKIWMTRHDELTCGVCGPLHRQPQPIDQPFVLADGTPIWAPGVHPNCRCWLELHRGQGMQLLLEKRISKAQGDDPYDRDANGRFAEREGRGRRFLRNRPLRRRLQVLDRPQVSETRTAPEPATQPATADPFAPAGGADPFAQTSPADPFAAAQVADPFAQVATADPFAQVATADPFAQVATADPFAPPKTKAGNKIIIIRRDGTVDPEGVPDDHHIVASADWYHGAFEGDKALGQSVPEHLGDSVLGHEITAADIGKVVDFDLWSEAMRNQIRGRTVYPEPGSVGWKQMQEREQAGAEDDPHLGLPGFPAFVLPTGFGNAPLLDVVHQSQTMESDEAWSQVLEDSEASGLGYFEARAQEADAAFENASEDIQRMPMSEIISVYLDAGLKSRVDGASDEELRRGLIEAVEDVSSTEHEYLVEAYLEHQLEQGDLTLAADHAFSSPHTGEWFEVPQVFTFDAGNMRADRVAGSQLRMRGKYRISNVRIHSYRGQGQRFEMTPDGTRVEVPHHPNVLKWREIQLVPIDEDE